MNSVASEHILGLDGIAIIVNESNPIERLDREQIMRIFTGQITDWSQVGPYRGKINLFARNDDSGMFDTFKSLVLEGKPLATAVQRFEDSRELSEAVANDPDGIGFIGLPYILSAKPIAVSRGEPSRCYLRGSAWPLKIIFCRGGSIFTRPRIRRTGTSAPSWSSRSPAEDRTWLALKVSLRRM